MRDVHPDVLTLLQARRGIVARLLVWIVAKNRTTGALEANGFWNGDQDATMTIAGESRLYVAAGALLGVEPVTEEIGATVRMQVIRLSGISPEAEQVLRGYEPRLAPVELHRMVFDPVTMAQVGAEQLLFRGAIDRVKIMTPAIGGPGVAEVTVASNARDLTRGLRLKKSDESQQLRSGDRFRRYADVSGKVKVWWGQKPRKAPTQSASPGKPRSGGLRRPRGER
jgi:hypothetical protein